MANWINQKLIEEKNIIELHRQFMANKPFKHVVIRKFLKKERADELLKALRKEKFYEKESDLFSFKQTQDLHHTKNKTLMGFVELLTSREFSEFVMDVSGIKVQAGAFDLSGTLYESCDYLLCHDDELEGRKIAYIYYLSDLEEEDGGALAFLGDNSGKPGRVERMHYPEYNSLVFFEVSKESWHEVQEVLSKKKRYAIGGWLH